MTKMHKREALAAVHETAEALQVQGVINKTTMKEFDVSCLTPAAPISPAECKEAGGAGAAAFVRSQIQGT